MNNNSYTLTSNNALPHDNEFFILREKDNAEILRRIFVVTHPEVYNHHPPQNTQLIHDNVSERLLKYSGIDQRSRNYWSEYLNGKNKGLSTNPDKRHSNVSNEKNSLQNDFKPYVAGVNKNIHNENSLRGLGRLNKYDTTHIPELVGLEKVMTSMDLYDKYFSVSNNLDNARFFIGNPTRAVNNNT